MNTSQRWNGLLPRIGKWLWEALLFRARSPREYRQRLIQRIREWLWDALLFVLALVVMSAPVEYFFQGVVLEQNMGARIYHLLVIIATPLLALMLLAMHKAEEEGQSKDTPLPPGVMPPGGWPSLRRLQAARSGATGKAFDANHERSNPSARTAPIAGTPTESGPENTTPDWKE
jgi:hypothetical protein